jgi:hypothetical protein
MRPFITSGCAMANTGSRRGMRLHGLGQVFGVHERDVAAREVEPALRRHADAVAHVVLGRERVALTEQPLEARPGLGLGALLQSFASFWSISRRASASR